MKRLGQFLRSLADRVDPPQQSEAEFRAALKREAEEGARRRTPLTPAEHLAIAVSLIPSNIARDPYLMEIEKMRLEAEIDAEYPESLASKALRRDIERANRPTAFARKLRSVPR